MEEYPASKLISRGLNQVDWSQVWKLETKRYAPNYLDNDTANQSSWEDFCQKAHTLHRTPIGRTDMQALVVPKSVTWSDRDTNIYIGSRHREIRSFMDLSHEDFAEVFGWHINASVSLSGKIMESVYSTHGFNPVDTSPDAHSIRAKFHTHIHIPDKNNRVNVDPDSLNTFERLMLIEPFAAIYRDFTADYLRQGALQQWAATYKPGHLSLTTKLSQTNRDSLVELSALLYSSRQKYEEIVDVFTDRTTEKATGYSRYIPRDTTARLRLLDHFIKSNNWLSAGSTYLLDYLSTHLRPAQSRDSREPLNIASGGQLWLAKGFSGAFNFTVSTHADRLSFDFAPRIISTSGATKILSDGPTIIKKSTGCASAPEIARLRSFEKHLISAIQDP